MIFIIEIIVYIVSICTFKTSILRDIWQDCLWGSKMYYW